MTGAVPLIPRFRFVDPLTQLPLIGGTVTVYLAGTTTPANTYQDQGLTTPNTNPVTLDVNGECLFWVDSAYTYKLLLKDSSGSTVTGWPVDNIPGGADVGAAAAAAAAAAAPYAATATAAASAAAGSAGAALAAAHIYASQAAAQGDGTLANGSYYAVPQASPSTTFYDLYIKVSGVASTYVNTFPSLAALSAYIDGVNKGVYFFGRKTGSFVLGKTTDPATGVAQTATYTIANAIPRACALTGFKFYASGIGTVKLKRLNSSAVEQANVTLNVVAGLNTFTTKDIGDFQFAAGEIFGWFSSVGYLIAGTDTRAAYYNGGAGDTLTPARVTLQTGFVPQIQATFSYTITSASEETSNNAFDSRVREEAKVVHRIGHQSDTVPDGTSAASTGHHVFLDPVRYGGRIAKFRAYMNADAYVTIYRWTRSGDTMTQDATPLDIFKMPAGYSEISLDIPVEQGVYLSAQSGSFRQTASTKFAGRGFFSTAATSFLVDGSTLANFTTQSHFCIELEYSSYLEQVQKHEVKLGRTDSIVVIGNSYMAGAYHPYKKTPIAMASQMSPWNFHNFSVSSQDLGNRLADIRSGADTFYANTSDGNTYGNTGGGATLRDYRPTYALILLATNHASAADLYSDLHDTLETVRAIGSIPLLVTEIAPTFLHAAAYRQAAESYGGYFLGDLTQFATMFPQTYAGFDRSGHKSSRVTQSLYSASIARLVDAFLGYPRSGMKLYRPRPNVTISAITDLMFEYGDDLRHGLSRVWQEIEGGGGVVTVGDANIGYMDNIQNTGAYTTTAQKYSEYDAALLGHSLSFTDYALLSVHLDAQPQNVREVRAYVGTGLTTVYARTVFTSGAYAASGGQQGFWSAIPVTSDGWAIIREWEISGRVSNTGRVDFLLVKAGAFTLQNPQVVWWGAAGKTMRAPISTTKPRGSELIATPYPYSAGALASGWTSSGAPTYANTANGGDLPSGATGYARLISTDTISYAITGITADPFYGREVEVTVWACGEKALVNGAAFVAATAPMSGDSWDGEQITVEHVNGANAAKSIKTVMPYWQEVRAKTWLAAGATTITVRLGCASTGTNADGTTKAVLVARASCKLVEA